MRFSAATILVMATMAITSPGQAATTVGDVDCAEWVDRNSPAMRQWLLGFMSGLNVQWASDMQNRGKEPLEGNSSPEWIFRSIDASCRMGVHAGDKLSVRAFSLFLEMQKQR